MPEFDQRASAARYAELLTVTVQSLGERVRLVGFASLAGGIAGFALTAWGLTQNWPSVQVGLALIVVALVGAGLTWLQSRSRREVVERLFALRTTEGPFWRFKPSELREMTEDELGALEARLRAQLDEIAEVRSPGGGLEAEAQPSRLDAPLPNERSAPQAGK